MPPRIEPVGSSEIAARLGVTLATVLKWRERGIFPAPRWVVGGRPAWNWHDIEVWARHTGRIDGGR